MGNHRADRRETRPVDPAPRVAGGRRRAVKASSFPRHPLTGLPMVPTVAGALAVAVAAGGAVTAGIGEASATEVVHSSSSTSAPAFAEFDTLGMGAKLDDRQRAISRDSERDAQRDAAGQKLQAAVEIKAQERNAELTSLARSAEKQASKISKNQWFLPTTGYHLTARFGSAGGLWSSNHTGLDFAAPEGTPIVAVANGVITETGYDGSYGNKTVETLADGTEIWYAHQSVIGVHAGDVVRGGQQIGNIGSTGNTTGPHVHLEVRPGGGDPVDPYTALVYHGLHP
jgi:murein DD-endopeptidase MepM/ murein hydrolase activator NlpD